MAFWISPLIYCQNSFPPFLVYHDSFNTSLENSSIPSSAGRNFFSKAAVDTDAFLVYINLKKVNHVTHAHYTIVLKRISNTAFHAAFNQSVFQQSPKQTFCAVIKKKLVTD
ncbi:MAG TPA: hypothetical protein VK369_02810 [Segetibacter sp.]|nr:hypothetical protein [Segetibacter sp.]